MQEAINRKYTEVKNVLDQMDYIGTLHPDSVTLVEKLIKDLKKISKDNVDLKSKLNSRAASEISNNTSYMNQSDDQHRFDLLNKQYCEMKQKYKEVKDENQSLKNGPDSRLKVEDIRNKYDNKMTEMINKLENFEKKEKKILGQKKRLEQSVDQLSRELDNVKDELFSKERILLDESKQLSNIRKQYDDVLNTTGALDNRRNEQLNAIIERKSSRIMDLQQQNLTIKAKITSLKNSLQQGQIQKRHMLLQNKNLNCLVDSLKSQISQISNKNIELKSHLDNLHKQEQVNRKHRLSLERQLQQMQSTEIQRNYSNQAKQSAKQKLHDLLKETSNQLQNKRQECQSLEIEKQQLNKIVKGLESKVNEMSNKNIILNKNIGSLQEEYDLINGKYAQKMKELHEINVKKEHLQRAGKQVEPMKIKYIQLQAKYNQLLSSGEAVTGMEIKGKVQYQHQIRVLQQQISLFKQRDSQLQIRNQKLSNQLQRIKIYMDNGNKQMQIVNSQKQALLKQNNQMKEQLDSLSLKIHSTKTDQIKKTEKMNSDEILIHDLKSKLDTESDKVRSLLNENKLLQTNVRKYQQKNRQLYEDNVQLKSMYESLEHNKNQLLGKLKRSTSQREFVQTQKIKESGEIGMLRQKIIQYEQRIRETDEALLNINNLRDQQEVELNKKIEESSELSQRVRKLQQMIRGYDQTLGQNDHSLLGLQSQLKNMQNQNTQLIRRSQKLQEQLNQVQNHAHRLQNDIKRRSNDQSLLITSNKDLTKQIQTLEHSLLMMKQSLDQRTMELDENRTNYQMNRLQFDEMKQNQNGLVNEIKRLTAIINQLEPANNHMYQTLGLRDSQIQALTQNIHSSQYKQAQYLAEIQNYERQLTMLTSQLNVRDSDLREVLSQRDFLKSEVSQSKKQPAIDWKSVMQQRLQHTQCQLNIKKQQLSCQISQNRLLTKALQQQRTHNYNLSRQLQQGHYNSHLGTPIRNLMSESMQQSQIQNNSMHSNRIQTDINMKSFDSDNSRSSQFLKNQHMRILQKFNNRTKQI